MVAKILVRVHRNTPICFPHLNIETSKPLTASNLLMTENTSNYRPGRNFYRRKAGRPRSQDPVSQITLTLPGSYLARLDAAAKAMKNKRTDILRLAFDSWSKGADYGPFGEVERSYNAARAATGEPAGDNSENAKSSTPESSTPEAKSSTPNDYRIARPEHFTGELDADHSHDGEDFPVSDAERASWAELPPAPYKPLATPRHPLAPLPPPEQFHQVGMYHGQTVEQIEAEPRMFDTSKPIRQQLIEKRGASARVLDRMCNHTMSRDPRHDCPFRYELYGGKQERYCACCQKCTDACTGDDGWKREQQAAMARNASRLIQQPQAKQNQAEESSDPGRNENVHASALHTFAQKDM